MSLETLRGKHTGEIAWIVGKGPSLEYLQARHFGHGPVIAMNQAIAVVQNLGLKNQIYSMQKDGCGLLEEHEICDLRDGAEWMIAPGEGVQLLLQPEYSEWCLQRYERILVDPVTDLGFEHPETMCVQMCIAIAKLMGCFEIVMVCCDSLRDDIFETYDVHQHKAYLTGAGEYYPYVRPLVLKDLSTNPHRILIPTKEDIVTNKDEIIKNAGTIPSWTSDAERCELLKLSQDVKAGGLIVEIGGLYGGMTAVIGLANPASRIVVVDNFSWSPIKERPASSAELLKNTAALGLTNVTVREGDSREIGKQWTEAIDLLWIDGGHSYEFVRSDLELFAPHAQTVALHDWDNPFWPDIRRAVENFISHHAEWNVDHNTEMVVVLRRRA